MTEKDTKFQQLMELLVKIEKTSRHCKVEINWDGSQFKWNVTIGGLRASEFNPAMHLPPGEKIIDGDE